MNEKDIEAHFIEEGADTIYLRKLISVVPRVGDEIRTGGEGSEVIHKVTRVVFVYDEPVISYDRVNIGIEQVEDSSHE